MLKTFKVSCDVTCNINEDNIKNLVNYIIDTLQHICFEKNLSYIFSYDDDNSDLECFYINVKNKKETDDSRHKYFCICVQEDYPNVIENIPRDFMDKNIEIMFSENIINLCQNSNMYYEWLCESILTKKSIEETILTKLNEIENVNVDEVVIK